jgi:hypothetical protein
VGLRQPPTEIIDALGSVERTFGAAGVMRWWPLLSGLGFGGIGVALVVGADGFGDLWRWVGLGIVLVVVLVVAAYPPGRITVHEHGLAARRWGRWVAVRWDEIVSLQFQFTDHYTSASALVGNSPLYSTKVCHVEHRGHRLPLALSNSGVAEVDELIRMTDGHTRARLERDAWAAAKTDGSDHGWFRLHDRDGITFGISERHPWSAIASFSLVDNTLVFELADGQTREAPLQHVANPHAAVAILTARARMKKPLSSP